MASCKNYLYSATIQRMLLSSLFMVRWTERL
nr:MAG TPA: hypothetical protein [Caudoviricetes sp.]